MSSWLNEYLVAIEERDVKEKINQGLYYTYARLADRSAGLGLTYSTEGSSLRRNKSSAASQDESPRGSKKPSPNDAGLDDLAKIRRDLSEAQRSKGAMELEIQGLAEEIQRLRAQSKLERKRINELALERTNLATRMRDQDEELKVKAKLLEHIHDETVSLTLELNMAEEQSRKLEQENKELIDRWMARMGEEADAMNNASRFS